jgi:hypothetical protein
MLIVQTFKFKAKTELSYSSSAACHDDIQASGGIALYIDLQQMEPSEHLQAPAALFSVSMGEILSKC